MKKLGLALFTAFLGLAPVRAQNFTMPPPAGVTAAGVVVVSSCGTQSITAGQFGYLTEDTTGTLCSAGGGGGGGGGAVFGPTAAGTAAANPPVLMGGTVDGTATGAVDNWKVSAGVGFVQFPSAQSISVASGGIASGGLAAGAMVDLLTMRGSASGGTAAADAILNGGIYNSSAPTLTTGQQASLQLDASGNLDVNIKAGAGSGGTALADQATFTQGTTSETPMGCLYITSYSAGTTGKSTVMQCDSTGHPLVNPGTIATWGLAAVGGATAPTNQQAIGAEYLSSAPTYTTGETGVLQMTAAGSLHTTVDNSNANGAAAASASTPVTPANNPVGSAAWAATQVSVGSSATSILAARTGVSGTGRICATIENTSTTAVWLGGSGVTTSTGMLLPGILGASDTICTTAAIYGIVATGSETVSAQETY